MPPPAERSGQAGGGGRLRRAALATASWFVPARNPGGAVNGLIAVGALLAAESRLRETQLETAGSVAIAIVVYWLAHAYSAILGSRLERERHLEAGHVLRILAADSTIVTGALLPLLAVLLAWAAGGSQPAAVNAGLYTAVGSLVAFELAAGLRAHDRAGALALDAAVGVAFGLGILLLKIVAK